MRNVFLLIAAICMTMLGCQNGCNPSSTGSKTTTVADTNTVYVRKDIYSYAPTSSEIMALKAGVTAMKARAASDPTSWSYQAAMHGSYVTPALANWNQCQHGTFFFLAWHRIYLYYFERILRKASGDNSFVLPYWNYSDNLTEASLPEVFRLPANASNPLYVSQRDVDLNAGDPLDPSVVSYSAAMTKTNFTSSSAVAPGFGGITVAAPVHFHGSHGALESQPHDVVHVAIGGWMGDPNTAAQDPVFYLHHCNIDRLWEKWLRMGGGRANPTGDANWMNTQFTFYDENGSPVQLSGSQIVSIATQLKYTYDDVPKKPPINPVIAAAIDSIKIPPRPEQVNFFKVQNIATKGGRSVISIGSMKRVKMDKFVSLALTSQKDTSQAPVTIKLMLEGVTYDSLPSGLFEVYINMPEREKPSNQSNYYVGNIGLFGFMTNHGDMSDMKGMETGGTVVLDITPALARLQDKKIDIDNLQITIVHRPAVVSKRQSDTVPFGDIKIRTISVIGLK